MTVLGKKLQSAKEKIRFEKKETMVWDYNEKI